MLAISEIDGDKQSIEAALYAIHNRLKCYTNDQITIVDDLMLTIESFYKTEKHAHERMTMSLQKSLEHAQNLSYLGSSVIGTSWTAAVKELIEHYAQREASYPVLKQVVLENLRRIKNEKIEEQNKVLLYDEEIIKEMLDIERRVLKTKRIYDDACDRFRQKDSGIKRLHQIILSKNELERLENAVVDTRNMYILQVNQMNYALKFYIEQFIVDLDKLLACDLFPQIKQTLNDLVYSEYKRLHDILQRATDAAIENGDEQKKRLLPKIFQNYPLIMLPDQSDQINTDDKYIPQLSSAYLSAINDVRDADQQIQLALETSVLNAQQNKESRMDPGKIRLKRMEMRKTMASFIIDTLETLVPNIKTARTSNRTSRLIGGLRPIISPLKPEMNLTSVHNSISDTITTGTLIDFDSTPTSLPPTPTSPLTQIYPCQAIVLYDFEGANEDEMSVKKDDKVFIESKPEYEGWLVAKGRERSGLVPESYVQLIPPLVVRTDLGAMKKSADEVKKKKNKSFRKTNKSTIDALAVSSSPITADYFSEE